MGTTSAGTGIDPYSPQNPLRPTGSIAETCDRNTVTTTLTPTSGTVCIAAVYLKAGDTVSSISIRSAVGITTPTHWQLGLYTAAGARVAQSADQTSTAFGTNVTATLAMQTPYNVTQSGVYYVAFFYTGSNLTLRGPGITDQMSAIAPGISFTADTGVTALPATLGATTILGTAFYAYLS